MNGYLLALIVFIVYIILILILRAFNILERINASLIGPLLMIRTQKGKGLIERLSRYKRFWRAYATFGILLCLFIMVLMFISLVLGLYIVVTTGGGDPIPPEKMLVLPGINPIVPLWYGIFALFIAIVVHEFSHGILARLAKVKIKSLGALLCVIPIGAFVEPDDEELKSVSRGKRARVFAAGPMSNIVLGLICAAVFSWSFMASLTPISDGVLVVAILKDSPGADSGFEAFDEIVEIDGTPISDVDDFLEFDGFRANATIPEVKVLRGGDEVLITDIVAGLVISSVSSDLPASDAGLEPGMIIDSIDGIPITSDNQFGDFMKSTSDGQVISIVAYVPDDVEHSGNSPGDEDADREAHRIYIRREFPNITLAHKYDYYKDMKPLNEEERKLIEETKGVGYLGISSHYLGIGVTDPDDLVESLAHPVRSAESRNEARDNLLKYTFTYPWDGKVLPFHEPLTAQYEVQGFWSFLPTSSFWVLANIFYYLFWINFLLGTFNALPAIPFDGGYIFKDSLSSFLSKIKKNVSREIIERQVQSITFFITLTVMISILGVLFLPFVR